MDTKKIIKKSNTLTGLMITILLVIGIFTGMYSYLVYHASDSGTIINSNITNANNTLATSQEELSSNIYDIQHAVGNISEAESGFIVAINGFRGLGAILKLPLNFVNVVRGSFDAMLGVLEPVGIPKWITALVLIGLTGYVVFLVLRIVKGEQYTV